MCDGKLNTVSKSVLVSLKNAVNLEVNTNGKAHWKLITLQIVMYVYEPEHNKMSFFYDFYQGTIQFQMYWLVFSTAL
jgi:hypothetical protein